MKISDAATGCPVPLIDRFASIHQTQFSLTRRRLVLIVTIAILPARENIVVKCPLIPEGLKATKQLASEGIRVNVTLCFSPTQALLAAKAGAWCVSPFIGLLDDISSDGMELIDQILTNRVVSIGHLRDQHLGADLVNHRGGNSQAPGSTAANTPSGNIRTRLPGIPPPVMWAIPCR